MGYKREFQENYILRLRNIKFGALDSVVNSTFSFEAFSKMISLSFSSSPSLSEMSPPPRLNLITGYFVSQSHLSYI